MGYAVYSGLVALVTGAALVPYTWLRTAAGHAWRTEQEERLGWVTLPAPAGRRIIVHAVSAGESVAAAALIRELERAMPDVSVVLTSGTVAGRLAAERLKKTCPAVERCLFMPWDGARRMRLWIQALRPSAAIVVETEIWPNLFRACREAGVPLALVNARVSSTDADRYARARWFFTDVLGAARWICAQSDEHARRLERIGAPADRLAVTGNLKFDAPISTRLLPERWRESLETPGLLIVAGSTHEPEERWLAECLLRLREDLPTLRLVMAPRDPRRAESVQRMLRRLGVRAARWSQSMAAWTPWDVLLVDQYGLLPSLYRFADVAVVGGTLSAGGGHSPIEAAIEERALLLGPHVSDITELVAELIAQDACVQLPDGGDVRAQLYQGLRSLLRDPERRTGMGLRARAWYDAHHGVASVVVDHLKKRVLPADRDTSA